MQLTHYNSKFKKQKHAIRIVCNNITNAPNIGSLFRISDAFNIEELIFCGDSIPIGRRMTKTSRATENHVSYCIENDINVVINKLKLSHLVIGLEITEDSLDLRHFKLSLHRPIALIIGNENHGISDTILKQCNAVVHINMYGHNSSMNVVQATSIALYEMTRQLNQGKL